MISRLYTSVELLGTELPWRGCPREQIVEEKGTLSAIGEHASHLGRRCQNDVR
jgi:hypothetical protein